MLCTQDSEAVEVTLGLTMNQLLDVDTTVGTMTGLYWFNLEWKDEYLVWDEAKNGVGYTHLSFSNEPLSEGSCGFSNFKFYKLIFDVKLK